MRTSDTLLWRTLRFFQMDRIYRMAKGVFPMLDSGNGTGRRSVYFPLVIPEALERQYKRAWKRLSHMDVKPGDYLEFGVSHGTSMSCMHRVVTALNLDNVRLYGFDSFAGLPPTAATEDNGKYKPGEFASTIEKTRQNLGEEGIDWNRTHLIRGWFEDTLHPDTTKSLGIEKVSIIMFDCRLYTSTKAALDYAGPLIVDFAIIFFGCWHDDPGVGECRAYTEFLKENTHLKSMHFGKYKPSGQAFFVTSMRE